MGSKGSSAPAPAADPRVGEAAMKNIELGEQWLGFARQQFDEGNVRQDRTDALTRQVIDQQMQTQDRANAWAAEDRARTKGTFQPLEDAFIREANDYGSQERQDHAAAEVGTAVAQQRSNQQAATYRDMARMGINPSSAKFQATQRGNDTVTALSAAGQMNSARQAVRDRALQLRADALNIGKGLASSTAAAYGVGLNAGNSAVGNNASANQQWNANNQVMQQGLAGNMQGNSSGGGLLATNYSQQLQATQLNNQNAQAGASGFGQIVGIGSGLAVAF